MPTTLLVLTASPADRAAPRKLASREIAKSASPRPEAPATDAAANTKGPETGPWRGTRRIRPAEPEALPPACDAILAAPCTVMHKDKIPAGAEASRNPNKLLLPRQVWLRIAKPRATRPILCPASYSHPQAEPGVRFFGRPAYKFLFIRGSMFSEIVHSNAQRQNPRWLRSTRKIGSDSQSREQPAPPCAPPQTRSLRPNPIYSRSFAFIRCARTSLADLVS